MIHERFLARQSNLRSRFVAMTCALAATSACAGDPFVEISAEKPEEVAFAVSSSEPRQLNLLSGGQIRSPARVNVLEIGDGSYLCTPAGFGQRSWCRRN